MKELHSIISQYFRISTSVFLDECDNEEHEAIAQVFNSELSATNQKKNLVAKKIIGVKMKRKYLLVAQIPCLWDRFLG